MLINCLPFENVTDYIGRCQTILADISINLVNYVNATLALRSFLPMKTQLVVFFNNFQCTISLQMLTVTSMNADVHDINQLLQDAND